MLKIRNLSNYAFWLLVVVTLLLASLGAVLVNWQYRQGWIETVWHVCQSGLQNLGQHGSITWQLAVLIIISVVVIRGGRSVGHQVWSTRRFAHLFLPLRETPPVRVQTLLATHNLSAENIVYLNLAATHAFCLGFWRPRIWLTAGLVDLLTDEELTAVLVHEVYHCRRRDPLRLLISRALKSTFFFLPLVGDLANFVELQQEIAADQSVIEYLGDDLPLLCSLQKLLVQGTQETRLAGATFTPFNITETRLRRLIYPSQSIPFSWHKTIASGFINVGVVIFLYGIVLLSTQPVVKHQEIGACLIDEVTIPLQTQLTTLPEW